MKIIKNNEVLSLGEFEKRYEQQLIDDYEFYLDEVFRCYQFETIGDIKSIKNIQNYWSYVKDIYVSELQDVLQDYINVTKKTKPIIIGKQK